MLMKIYSYLRIPEGIFAQRSLFIAKTCDYSKVPKARQELLCASDSMDKIIKITQPG